MLKKVRIENSTSDNTDIRVYILHYDDGVQLGPIDLESGYHYQTGNVMKQGCRAVVVYEQFNQHVIAIGYFELKDDNVKVIVSGDATGGYNLSYA